MTHSNEVIPSAYMESVLCDCQGSSSFHWVGWPDLSPELLLSLPGSSCPCAEWGAWSHCGREQGCCSDKLAMPAAIIHSEGSLGWSKNPPHLGALMMGNPKPLRLCRSAPTDQHHTIGRWRSQFWGPALSDHKACVLFALYSLVLSLPPLGRLKGID